MDERVKILREALGKAKREHYSCQDCWYSCPMSEDGCCDERKPKECDCGADKFNAWIDSVLASTADSANGDRQ